MARLVLSRDVQRRLQTQLNLNHVLLFVISSLLVYFIDLAVGSDTDVGGGRENQDDCFIWVLKIILR